MDGISVLITVYKSEKGEVLDRALRSIWDDQLLKPNEIVLVEDGPLPEDLYRVIDNWQERLGKNMVRLCLPENVGLGNALRTGITRAKFSYIARMDTDDISLSTRFRNQYFFLSQNKNVDIVGTQIMEFSFDEQDLRKSRILPLSHKELVSFSKKRSPFNHPSVMYKKEVYIDSMTKINIFHQDDYATWVNFIVKGYRLANLDSVELLMRAGEDQMTRRGGLHYLIDEIKMFREFKKIGHLNYLEFYWSLLIRLPVRLAPKSLRYLMYQKFVRK